MKIKITKLKEAPNPRHPNNIEVGFERTYHDMKEQMLKMLEDTANHYNSNNRAMKDNGQCMYLAPNGNKCAVGRYLNEEHKDYKAALRFNFGVGKLLKRFPNILTVDVPISFLSSLQDLHDRGSNWNEKGLSEKGEEYYQEIKSRILSDYYIKS